MAYNDKLIIEKDWEKCQHLEKEIKDLLKKNKNYKNWELADDLSIEDPSSPISVITPFRAETAGTERPYFKKKEEFIKQMATILEDDKYGLTITHVEDEVDLSKGVRYRRIDVYYKLKTRN